MQFDRGYISPYFVTNSEKMEAQLENPYILIYDKKISTLKEILPILEQTVQTGRPSSSSLRTSIAKLSLPSSSTACVVV